MREIPDFDIYIPSSLSDALDYLSNEGKNAFIIAGCTDFVPMVKRGRIRPSKVLDISHLKEMRYIKREDGFIKIGALTTISDLVSSSLFDYRYGGIKSLERYFGVVTTRNMATVGGNIASGGERDLVQIFLALDAQVKIRSLRNERFTSPKEVNLNPGERITEIIFRELGYDSCIEFSKFEKRAANGISVCTSAVTLKLADNIIESIRIVVNRVRGKEPGRLYRAEQKLVGKSIDDTVIQDLDTIVEEEIDPAGDFRGSKKFRKEITRVLVKRTLLKCIDSVTGGKNV